MKILKYVFLLLVLAAVAVTVFIATQEGKYDIKEERIIKAPKAVLYNYISDYRNWENVNIFTGSDTTAIYSYTGKSTGPGAKMSWEKNDVSGEILTQRVIENDSIIQKATIDNLDTKVAWIFADTLNSTKVTVRLKGELSFREKATAFFKGGLNDSMEKSLSKGLNSLDNFLVKELAVYDVEVKGKITKTGTYYLGHAVESKLSEVNRNASEIFPKLLNFMSDNKIVKKGSPFILYKSFNTAAQTAQYLICIPIKEEIFTMPGSEYEGGKTQDFLALKTTLKGDYSHLPEAWDKAKNYIAEKGLQENTTGQYIELYTKNVQKTRRPSEWVTDIYIPLGAPTILPAAATTLTPVPSVAKPVVQPRKQPAVIPNPVAKPAATTTATKQPASTTVKPTTGVAKPASPKPAANTNPAQ